MEAAARTDDLPYASVEEILARVHPPLAPEHADYVRQAYEIAREAHEGQQRESGDPYFSHCVEVASLLADLVSDWPTLAAGLLHDTIEDCGFTTEQIRALLPDPVSELVDGVTKVSSIHFDSDREHQAGNLRKMILAMARDVRVVLIKLCDRLHNMRTLKYLDPARQKSIAAATIEIYAPLANRLGMERIYHELQDLSMSYLHPVLYRRLSEHLERNRERYETIINKTREILEAALSRAHIGASVTGRLKHIYSIYIKMLRQDLVLDEIHDLIAIRIVTKTVAEAYEALGIVHGRWKPAEGKFKDYIASPKPNGYRSIHSSVMGVEGEMCEIQIRTEEMHRAADEGIAAHWKYKEDGGPSIPDQVEAEKLVWLRQLVDWLTDIRDPNEFMAAVKQDVFDATVFCYTPAGDVIELPKEASALDFAYRIHTEVGHRCSGVKVNYKMATLRTRLETGDIVEVLTSKTAHPTRDWVQIARTNRARNKIRHWLKTHDRETYLERGRASLMAELRLKVPVLTENEAMEKIGTIAGKFSLHSAEDVLVEIGFGTVKLGAVISKLVQQTPQATPPPKSKAKTSRKKRKPGGIVVDDLPGAITRMAKCCRPVPGDPIVGFVTRGRGISIHHEQCPSFRRSRELHAEAPHRLIGVEWSDGSAQPLQVSIRAVCQDRQGLLKDITQAITQQGISIIGSNSQSNLRTNMAIIKMKVIVPDQETLNTLLRRIEAVPMVRSLTRMVHRH